MVARRFKPSSDLASSHEAANFFESQNASTNSASVLVRAVAFCKARPPAQKHRLVRYKQKCQVTGSILSFVLSQIRTRVVLIVFSFQFFFCCWEVCTGSGPYGPHGYCAVLVCTIPHQTSNLTLFFQLSWIFLQRHTELKYSANMSCSAVLQCTATVYCFGWMHAHVGHHIDSARTTSDVLFSLIVIFKFRGRSQTIKPADFEILWKVGLKSTGLSILQQHKNMKKKKKTEKAKNKVTSRSRDSSGKLVRKLRQNVPRTNKSFPCRSIEKIKKQEKVQKEKRALGFFRKTRSIPRLLSTTATTFRTAKKNKNESS